MATLEIQKLRMSRQEMQEIQNRFQRNNTMIMEKLVSFIPPMILSNLAVLLLASVDGLVVGNLINENALSSVSIFVPISMAIGVLSALFATGIANCLFSYMSQCDTEGLLRMKHAGKVVMVGAAVLVATIAVPVVSWLITLYHLPPEVEAMTREYAVGMMIAMPAGLIATIGALQLQILGKVKVLLFLSAFEGIFDLLLDLLFVSVFKMGIAGVGIASAISCNMRTVLTILYLAKKTDVYKSEGRKATLADIKDILVKGLPEAAYNLMRAAQNMVMMIIIIKALGVSGSAVKAVCSFSFQVALVFVNGLVASMRPLASLFNNAKDYDSLRVLMRQCFRSNLIFMAIIIGLCEFFPNLFFLIHGMKVSSNEFFMLRIFALSFIFVGFNNMFRLFFTIKGKIKHTTIFTILGSASLPLFAYVITLTGPGEWLWLSYSLTEVLILIANLLLYKRILLQDYKEEDASAGLLYLSVSPDQAIAASDMIKEFADSNGYDRRLSSRIRLCMEEMVAYAVKSQKKRDLNILVTVKFMEDEARFMMLDDGECIALDKEEETRTLITDNYGLLKKVAKSFQYQYILNMNYSVFTFS